MKLGRRVVLWVVGLDGLAFLLLFMLAAFRRSADVVIPAYALSWEKGQAFLGLLAWLPALQFLAVVLAVGSQEGRSEEVFSTALLPAAILSTLLAGASLILAPGYESQHYGLERMSARFNEALGATRSALAKHDPATARAWFGTLEAIDRMDTRVVALRDELLGEELKAARAASAPGMALKRAAPDEAAAAENLAKAKEAFRQRDYYSAHWLAGQAYERNPKLAEAKRLRDQAWGEILAQGTAPEDAARAAFFARKMEAFSQLRSGDAIGAYARFAAMAIESPGDPEVKRYLAESLAAVEAEAFFRDEAEAAAAVRTFPRFFIALPPGAGSQAFLAAEEIAFAPEVAYFFRADYLEIDTAGRTLLHVASPCAKLLPGRLYLESVERTKPELVYRPIAAGPRAVPTSLPVSLAPLTAYRLAVGQRAASSASVIDLFQGGGEAPEYRVDGRPFYLELLTRLGTPFALFGASVLGILLGLALRNPRQKVGLGAWFALPLMAAATGAAWLFLADVDLRFSRWILGLVQGPASLILSAGLRFILLALLIVLAAGLRHHGDVESD